MTSSPDIDTDTSEESAVSFAERRPPYRDRYDEWVQDPSPPRLRAVVDTLNPAIDYALRQSGQADDPYLKAKARRIAAEAVKTYSPDSGAGLPTWTTQQLIRLRRVARQSNVSTRLPERMQLDAWTVAQAEAQFHDQQDRDPDLNELSDATGLSKKRIEELRRTIRRTPSETALGDLAIQATTPQYTDEALSIVYDDLDYTDRKLLEMKTGFGGKYSPLPPAKISQLLNLSPTQVSRRSARIALKIHEMEDALAG